MYAEPMYNVYIVYIMCIYIMCMYRYTYISIFTHPQICRYFSETRFFHACCHTYVYTRTYVHMYIERRVLQKMDHTTIVRNPQSSLGLTFV